MHHVPSSPREQIEELRALRDRYDRQTAAWLALKERFSSLPAQRVSVAIQLLEEINEGVGALAKARGGRPSAGVRV